MELEITELFNKSMPTRYSASLAENPYAPSFTWNNAKASAPLWNLLDTEEKLDAFRAFVKESGGWSENEIQRFSSMELNALCIQWIAGDMREPVGFDMGPQMDAEDWEEYDAQCSAGNVAGRIFMGEDFKIYWSME